MERTFVAHEGTVHTIEGSDRILDCSGQPLVQLQPTPDVSIFETAGEAGKTGLEFCGQCLANRIRWRLGDHLKDLLSQVPAPKPQTVEEQLAAAVAETVGPDEENSEGLCSCGQVLTRTDNVCPRCQAVRDS